MHKHFREKIFDFKRFQKKSNSSPVRRPGIEPGPPAWQASILPLNQRRLPLTDKLHSAYFKAVVIAYVSYHSTGLLAGSIAHCNEPLSELLRNQFFAVLLFEKANFKFLKNMN